MTDRELLELAAKAAGVEGEYFHSENPIHVGIFLKKRMAYWNPLTDDGDALRLMSTLAMDVICHSYYVEVDSISEDWAADRCITMRRAIVRAAAEIGRTMA
ncbi:hypothetical protein [Pseudomonas typographi]|uniref:Uncharacterized protein n=1 Tax=Pseudomonas typographi TaxID=2715964 RepID=A0ABR7Z8U8_9PSED|nr:hypothetical protein [Pseudomonas typographi]MBD1601961.1 hypothetical protein [Pseudomonas typographi]